MHINQRFLIIKTCQMLMQFCSCIKHDFLTIDLYCDLLPTPVLFFQEVATDCQISDIFIL